MKWRRVVLVVVLAALLGGAVAWRWFAPVLAEQARRVAERELAAALGTPARIAALRVTVLPPAVEADGIAIGPDGAAASAPRLRVQLLPLASLRERRPVLVAEVEAPAVDAVAFPAPPASSPGGAVPPFRLQEVRATGARVRVPGFGEPVRIEVADLTGALEAGAAVPGLRLDLAARDVTALRGGERWRFDTVRASGREADEQWWIDSLQAHGDGVTISGSVSPAAPARFEFTADVDLQRLAVAIEPLAGFAGRARVDASLTNDLTDPVLEGTVQIAPLGVRGRTLGTLDATVRYAEGQLTLSPARLVGLGGELTVEGDLGLTNAMAYQAEVAWAGLDAERVADLFDDVSLRRLTASGRGQVSGTLDPLTVAAKGGGQLVPAAVGAPLDWHVDGEYRDGSGRAAFDAALGTVDRLHADVSLLRADALSGTVRVEIGDTAALRTLLWVEDVPRLTGTLAIDGALSGTLDQPLLEGVVAGRDLQLLAATVDRVNGRFILDRSALRSDGIDVGMGGGTLKVSGRVALGTEVDNDWQLTAAGVPTDTVAAVAGAMAEQAAPLSGGALSMRLTGKGRWPQAAIDGRATAERFYLGRESFERAELELALAWPRWDARLALHHAAEERLEVHAAGTGDDAAIELRSTPWALGTLRRAELERMGGTVELSGSLRGPLLRLNGTVRATGRELVFHGRRLGAFDLDAAASAGRWQLAATLLDGALRLRGSVGNEPGWPYALDGEWSAARLDALVSDQPTVEIETTGTVHVDGRLAAVADSNGRLELQALRLANGPYEVTAARPIAIGCRQGVCAIDSFELQGQETQLRARGTLRVDGIVAVAVEGNGDLRLLEFLGDPIESARGKFALRIDVARSAAGQWSVAGQVDVSDAALDAGLPVALTRTDGRLSLAGSVVSIDRLEGRVGGGTFSVGGRIDLDQGPALTWRAADVGAPLMPSLEFEVSGKGTVQGAWNRYTVAGTVKVERLLYDRKLELQDLLPSFERAVASVPRRERADRVVALDLVVYAPGNLFIENNIAHVEAWADLQVGGTAPHPVLNGRIEALEGEVYVRGRTFDVVYAALDFRPDLGLAAALNISLESTVDTPEASYTVGARVTGTTEAYRVALTSDDPALSQTEIATLIAFGGTSAPFGSGGGTGFSFYDALGYAGRPFASRLGEQAQQFLPLDRIEFEPSFSPTTGSFQPRLKIGKNLTDDLLASVGTTFGVESQTIAQLDYQLARRTSVSLLWESQTATQEGAFGGGMKFRYEFWRVRRFTLLGGLQ